MTRAFRHCRASASRSLRLSEQHHRRTRRSVDAQDLSRVRVRRRAGAPALLYLHGGGWVIGNLDSHDEICRWFANIGGLRRRLSRLSAGAGAQISRRPSRIAAQRLPSCRERPTISASMRSAHRRRRRQRRRQSRHRAVPACRAMATHPLTAQLLFYPNTDAAQTADSYRRFADGFGLTASTMAWFRDHYVSACPTTSTTGASRR